MDDSDASDIHSSVDSATGHNDGLSSVPGAVAEDGYGANNADGHNDGLSAPGAVAEDGAVLVAHDDDADEGVDGDLGGGVPEGVDPPALAQQQQMQQWLQEQPGLNGVGDLGG